MSRSDGGPLLGANAAAPVRWLVGVLVVAVAALVLAWNFTQHADVARAGWDESMHLDLPATRMLVAAGEGEWRSAVDVLQDCEQYPFVAPVYLALVHSVLGLGEHAARWGIFALWIAALVGLVFVGAEIQNATGAGRSPARVAGYVPFLLPVTLAILSPLATRYSWTLFLEVPVACAVTWTLVAWLRRLVAPSLARDVAVGAWIALTLFTKFNYGVLLCAGIAASWVLETALQRNSTHRGKSAVGSLGALALVPTLVCVWWFLAPFPDGFERAAEHRAAFWDYLVAERGTGATPWSRRIVDWATGVAPGPVALALVLVGVVASLGQLSRPAVRALWCVLLASGPAVWFHTFHLDRFLLPGAVVLWAAAGVGWYGIVRALDPWRRLQASLASLLLLPAALGWMGLCSSTDLANAAGVLSDEPELRAYQESVLRDMGWAGTVPSAGLLPAEHARILDWVEAELAPQETFAWIGLTSELSPASIHLELLARGGDRQRFLREAGRSIDVTPVPGMPDPGWTREQLEAFLEPFDVVFVSSPPDLKDRAGARAFEDRFQRPLIDELGYSVRSLGETDIAAPPGAPVRAKLYALRKQP